MKYEFWFKKTEDRIDPWEVTKNGQKITRHRSKANALRSIFSLLYHCEKFKITIEKEDQMVDYEIVDKADIPLKRGKQLKLFDPLPFEKAIKLEFPTREQAYKQGISIQGCLRRARGREYRVRIRYIPTETGYLLYAWKEKREGIKE